MKALVFLIFLYLSLSPLTSWAQSISKKTNSKKIIIKYKEHTQLDFSGHKVEGKIRSPQVFYIFQRKRNIGPEIIELPDRLDSERQSTKSIMEHNL